MEIRTEIVIRRRKLLSWKYETINANITNQDIVNYLTNFTSSFDLKYICYHYSDDSMIETWIKKITIYYLQLDEADHDNIIKFNISTVDLNKVRSVIKLLADKQGISVYHK